MPDENGEKRRDRNEKYGEQSPELDIPFELEHFWKWYMDISSSVRRVKEGVCEPIPPSEFKAWVEMTGNTLLPYEYDVLRNMDRKFCEETNEELKAYRQRREDELKRQN